MKKPPPIIDAKLGGALQLALRHVREAPPDRDDPWQFIAFAMARAKQAKGQLFQDLWALWNAGEKRDGYFVEVGAADGVFLSNTYMLEQLGWTGVLAEPNPRFAEKLKRRRCIVSNLCVSARSGDAVPFLAAEMGELSRLASVAFTDKHEERRQQGAEHIQVRTVTLDDLLEQHGAPRRIDYLSVDTEGAELEILGAFDFERWDVAAITVEHNHTPAREALYDLLTAKGYRRQFPELSQFDDWYVKA